MIRIKQLLTLFAFVPTLCQAQTATENYVKTTTMLDAGGSKSMQAVQYYNGLGYPTIAVANTGDEGETAYSLVTYDALGREERKFLPVSTGKSILYKTPDVITQESQSSNGYGDNAAYSLTKYDALDRPVSVTTAGSVFASKPSKIDYSANDDKEVICYGVGSTNNLTQNSYYPAEKLAKETSTDPDGKKVETYKDFFGNVILQRVGGTLCTYYVYDDLGHLRFVLPPKYQTEKDIAKTGYEYRYDDRGRVVYKKLPGAEYCEYKYDDADRMICYQDAEMRNAGKKRFFVYDKFNHLVIQGMCTACYQSGTVQNATFSSSDNGVLGTGYVLPSAFTSALAGAVLEIANYYDGNQKNIKSTAKVYQYLAGIQQSTSNNEQKGMLTATVSAAAYGQFVAQTMLYDIRGNLINTQSKEIGGKLVSNKCTYSFTNKLETSDVSANVYGGSFTLKHVYGYNRYVDTKETYSLTVNHGTANSASFRYDLDKLGRMTKVTRNGLPAAKQDVSYTYDMHGWLQKIVTNSFTEELYYASGEGTKYYNGNISSIKWKDNTSTSYRGYKYTYDIANRMTAGTYGEGSSLTTNVDRYSERMGYDANGNITSISRYGKQSSGYGLMDNLTITYSGNQLSNVSETVADYDYSGSFEYKKAKGSQYMYNRNGSLIADKSRGIVYITYDFNNNPKQIYFDNGNVTKYVYSASGEKLRVVHYTAKPNITRQFGIKPTTELTLAQILQSDSTDYLIGGSLVLKNGKIDKLLFDGGYAKATATGTYTDSFAFYYHNQDHLGNNREVVDSSGNVVQVTNYYPFGAPYADASAVKGATLQQYKYNGKELDTMHGLNSYDYGARQDDPILGRWDRIDSLCEVDYNISPYAFCGGNPINRVDKDGRIWETVWDAGNLFWDVGSAIYNHSKGNHKAAKANWTDASFDLAATLIPGVPAGATKLFKAANKAADVAKTADKAVDATKGLKNAAKIKEGLTYEKESLKASKKAGKNVTSQVRLVPENGKGNVKFNRTNSDQLIKNSDGTYSIVETKLSSKTPLSKGQKAAQKHVNQGNGVFEVRSNKGGLSKGDKIQVKEYRRENKYN